jgi:hypothetical protein
MVKSFCSCGGYGNLDTDTSGYTIGRREKTNDNRSSLSTKNSHERKGNPTVNHANRAGKPVKDQARLAQLYP